MGSVNQIFINIGIFFAYFFSFAYCNSKTQYGKENDIFDESSLVLLTKVALVLPPAVCSLTRFLIYQFIDKEETPIYLLEKNGGIMDSEISSYMDKTYLSKYKMNVVENDLTYKVGLNKEMTWRNILSKYKLVTFRAVFLSILQQFTGINLVIQLSITIMHSNKKEQEI